MALRPVKSKRDALERIWELEQRLKGLGNRIENLRGAVRSPRSRGLDPDRRDRSRSPCEELISLEAAVHSCLNTIDECRFDRGDEFIPPRVKAGPKWLLREPKEASCG